MTVEEALVALLAIAALVVLFLGLAQALEGRPAPRPRRGPRSSRAGSASDRGPETSPAMREITVQGPVEPVAPPGPAPGPLSPRSSPFARRPAPSVHPVLEAERALPGPAIRLPEPVPGALPPAPHPLGRSVAPPPEAPRNEAPGGPRPGRTEELSGAVAEADAPESARDGPAAAGGEGPPSLDRWTAGAESPPAEPALKARGEEFRGPAVPRAPAAPGDTPAEIVDRCAALFLGGQHGEALALAQRHLEHAAGPEWAGATGAALASRAGLARWELGDREAAQAGLARAADLAPALPAESCPPRMAALSLAVARRLLEAPGEGPGVHAARARLARFWLRWRLAAPPGDPDVEALLAAASGAIASAVGDEVARLSGAREWAAARRAIDEATSRGEIDETRARALDRLVVSAVKRDVERLVTPAIRGARDEKRAVHALGQAEGLLDSLPAGVLSAPQRAALGRRVAWAHARLGIQRVRAGSLDAGLEALAQALSRRGLGPARLRRVRETMVEALDALAVRAAGELDQPNGREDGVALVRELEEQIQRARALGVPARLLHPVGERAARLGGAPARETDA